jgi:ABC-type glutathione transport system ATPase component
MKSPVHVAVVGGSGSGKTWLAEKLAAALAPRAERLSLDDFYRDLSQLPLAEPQRRRQRAPLVLQTPQNRRRRAADPAAHRDPHKAFQVKQAPHRHLQQTQRRLRA